MNLSLIYVVNSHSKLLLEKSDVCSGCVTGITRCNAHSLVLRMNSTVIIPQVRSLKVVFLLPSSSSTGLHRHLTWV